MFVQQINITITSLFAPNFVPNVINDCENLEIYMTDNNPTKQTINKKIKMYKSSQNTFTGYRALSLLNYENCVNVLFIDKQTQKEKKRFEINNLDEENLPSNNGEKNYNIFFQLNYVVTETFDELLDKFNYDLILTDLPIT